MTTIKCMESHCLNLVTRDTRPETGNQAASAILSNPSPRRHNGFDRHHIFIVSFLSSSLTTKSLYVQESIKKNAAESTIDYSSHKRTDRLTFNHPHTVVELYKCDWCSVEGFQHV